MSPSTDGLQEVHNPAPSRGSGRKWGHIYWPRWKTGRDPGAQTGRNGGVLGG